MKNKISIAVLLVSALVMTSCDLFKKVEPVVVEETPAVIVPEPTVSSVDSTMLEVSPVDTVKQ